MSKYEWMQSHANNKYLKCLSPKKWTKMISESMLTKKRGVSLENSVAH